MNEDPLLDAPVPMATTRARRIDPVLKSALAREACEGGLVRTGAKATALLHRIRRWGKRRVGASTGNQTIQLRVGQYARAAEDEFSRPEHNVLSVAMDASRVSGKDTLYLAVFSPKTQKAFWAPPQVPLRGKTTTSKMHVWGGAIK